MAGLKEHYATKLLELSEKGNILEKDLEQEVLLRDTLGEPKVQAFLRDPHILAPVKHQLFTDSFSGKISEHLIKFLYLMIHENQESLIIPVLTEYIERANRRLGKTEAKVVAAFPLTKEQTESIGNVLTKKLDMPVDISVTVDPELIGGFYVLVDGHIFDGTVKSSFNNMKRTLKERKL
ncbi:ATP synthase F1 subunit delta [Anaerocolumna aminovalerica]|uniref:ATP synthase F1 subunit delta n=1 Tax=Anaerocolumna aminovalerica TaxID=1527 RepID=UPI00248C100C|nr:ATP synthase F1 subunit delta [Anaerocolumna aminovalerica]